MNDERKQDPNALVSFVFVLFVLLGPEIADLHPARILARGHSFFIFQCLVSRAPATHSICLLVLPPPLFALHPSPRFSPRPALLRAVMRLLPFALALESAPPTPLFMPEPWRQRRRLAASWTYAEGILLEQAEGGSFLAVMQAFKSVHPSSFEDPNFLRPNP